MIYSSQHIKTSQRKRKSNNDIVLARRPHHNVSEKSNISSHNHESQNKRIRKEQRKHNQGFPIPLRIRAPRHNRGKPHTTAPNLGYLHLPTRRQFQQKGWDSQ